MSGDIKSDRQIDEAVLDWATLAGTASPAPTPRSAQFDDVYFSGDGPAETEHVFLNGNNLSARFARASRFSIGELGFGSGLNLLCCWSAWRRAAKPAGAKLHFLSFEAYPLSPPDMARAHEAWPGFADLSARLRNRLPPPHPGFHQIPLDDDVTLTLYYGDALTGARQCQARIDAWFLDGFSPAKNPAMWSPELIRELASLSCNAASFATFTVAGNVRRALETAGFEWEKRPGHGRKRHMLAGKLNQRPAQDLAAAWFAPPELSLKPGARIAIIGGGVAGASLAYALTRAGFEPTVYDATAPASGASGNAAGLIMPRLDADDGEFAPGRFHASAYLHTLGLINRLQDEYATQFFNRCGALLHATTDRERERQKKVIAQTALPKGWIERHEDGLFFPQAGVIEPPAFVRALLGQTPIRIERVRSVARAQEGWLIVSEQSETPFDAVVIANGLDALLFDDMRGLPLTGAAGQIDVFPDAASPPHIHVFGPYAAPAPKGGLVIGATYAPIAIGADPAFTSEATQSNIAAVARTLPAIARQLKPGAARPRASVRCTTPDQLPLAGAVPDWAFYASAYEGLKTGRREEYPTAQYRSGLFALTGFGSRGLVTAPFAAAMLTAQLTGAPCPADNEVRDAIHPARYFIRDLRRQNTPS